ncbi:hypothetical protein [Mesonia aestuariivivens]|uniref:Outer membrane beta-barrel protein n=1 Tax=Mesonia aestuariivivens TaxID=2796128 RepID=A0ABS6W409_9FLAO|nr:hypothetical protein [Mesonia aestuariivivens]MBW2962580.1 hypothetical protein [Mesonia aestuariivivens]
MANQIRSILFICFLSIPAFLSAQTTDLARIEYMRIPFSNGAQSMNRFRGFIQAPIPIKEDYLIIGAEYRYLDLDFEDEFPFDPKRIGNTQRIEASLGYLKKIKETNWRIAVKGSVRISSNFERSLVSDDFIYNAAVYAINDVKKYDENNQIIGKPYRWIFGLIYTTTPGRNFPIPLINFHKEINRTWSYTAGVPKSLVRYSFNEKKHVQLFAMLDSYFSNIQNNVTVGNTNLVGENISMTNVTIGLGFEHYFTEHLLYYCYAGHTVFNEYRIRNNNRDDVYVIENDNTFYLRSGIKFKI